MKYQIKIELFLTELCLVEVSLGLSSFWKAALGLSKIQKNCAALFFELNLEN